MNAPNARRGGLGVWAPSVVPPIGVDLSDEQALATARQFVAIGCDAVKMEGGGVTVSRVRALIDAGIPVVGHLGLTPQQLRAGDVARQPERH